MQGMLFVLFAGHAFREENNISGVLKHFRTCGTIDSSISWKKFLKQLTHSMRYNRINCQIMWNSNHNTWKVFTPWNLNLDFALTLNSLNLRFDNFQTMIFHAAKIIYRGLRRVIYITVTS